MQICINAEINNLIQHSFNKYDSTKSSIQQNLPLPGTGERIDYGLGPALKNLSLVRFEVECGSFTAHAVGWGEQPT